MEIELEMELALELEELGDEDGDREPCVWLKLWGVWGTNGSRSVLWAGIN